MGSITELVFIIDCSKAMAGQEFETVSSINKTLDRYRRQDNVLVNIFTFNGEADMLYDRVDISQVKPLTISDVKAGGDSALFDTVASVVKHIRNIHHYIRKEDIPQKTKFFIYSSGFENTSLRYGRHGLHEMIDARKKQQGWEFIFEKKNIYTANKNLPDKSTLTTEDSVISDSDFKQLMNILKNGKFNW